MSDPRRHAFVRVHPDHAEFRYPFTFLDRYGCPRFGRPEEEHYRWAVSVRAAPGRTGGSNALHLELDSIRLENLPLPKTLLPSRAGVGHVWGEPPGIREQFDGAAFGIHIGGEGVTIKLTGKAVVARFFEARPDTALLSWCGPEHGSVAVGVFYYDP